MQSGAKQLQYEEQVFRTFILYKLEQSNIATKDVVIKLERDNSLPDAVRLTVTAMAGLVTFALRQYYGFIDDKENKPFNRIHLTRANSADIGEALGLDRWTMRSMVEAAAQDDRNLDPLKAMLWRVV